MTAEIQPKKRNRRARPRRLSYPLHRVLESGALYPGESEEAFCEFRERIAESLGGQIDFIDRMLITDTAEHAWEALRLRKLKASYLHRHIFQKIYDFLVTHNVPDDLARELLETHGNAKLTHFEAIEACLVKVHCSYAALEAEVVLEKMAGLREYDRMIATAEERRDYHLKELERRHGVRQSRVREEIVELAEGEFSTIGADGARK